MTLARRLARRAAHIAIRTYQLSLSSLVGRACRHLPSCSSYTDEAIGRHGLWAGGWMGLARICRCHPWGSFGFDPVPRDVPPGSIWFAPWRYGDWRGPRLCDPVEADGPERQVRTVP
jgi:putative membrane protein insertion efficiency factor